MARLLQIHSDGPGARTALERLAKALKSLAGNFEILLLGVFDGCGRISGKRKWPRLNRSVGGGDSGLAFRALCGPAPDRACRAA